MTRARAWDSPAISEAAIITRPQPGRLELRGQDTCMHRTARLDPLPPHLLVVDDDPDMVDWLGDLLERRGAVVHTALDGTEALQRIAGDEGFALVVTDVRMPAPTGIQLAAMTRYAGYCVPFIIITGFPDERVDAMVHRLERTLLLPKPFAPDDLLSACQRLIGFPQVAQPRAGMPPRAR